MSRQENIRKLMVSYNRRLQKLQEQEALKGISTPPEVLIEIEDIEAKLESLQAELSTAPQPATVAPMSDETIAQELARLGGSPAQSVQMGGINIQGVQGSTIQFGGNISANVEAGGDIVGGNKTETHTVTQGDPAAAVAALQAALTEWQRTIEAKLVASTDLDDEEKEEVKEKVIKVETEIQKGDEANLGRVERLLNSISAMAPDILEVTAKTLQNPFAGVGLVLEKIGDRIKLERAKSGS